MSSSACANQNVAVGVTVSNIKNTHSTIITPRNVANEVAASDQHEHDMDQVQAPPVESHMQVREKKFANAKYLENVISVLDRSEVAIAQRLLAEQMQKDQE